MSATAALMQQIYNDLRPWLVSCATLVPRVARNMAAPSLESIEILLDALSKQLIRSGDLIKLECRPSRFGPFLRHHFLTPFIGPHTSYRLGPQISGDPVLALLSQATTHWTPVGLFPPLESGGATQVCLYPSNSVCAGAISLAPALPNQIPHLFAIFAERHIPYCGRPCRVTGVIRSITEIDFANAGLTREDFEIARQQANIWMLDATADDSECTVLSDREEGEFWGGLYASGHLELDSGCLRINSAIDGFRAALKDAGYETVTIANHAGRREIALFGRGVRATIDTRAPFLYSLHMDAELTHNFGLAKTKFDRICEGLLRNLAQACVNESAEMKNANDLDFCYTDSAEAFTILRSLAADAIMDPLAVAIRDWHRRRSGPCDEVPD